MYKKISHNIVEEHFEHPAALPTGMLNNMHQGLGRYDAFWNNLITFNTDLRSYIKSELTQSLDNEFNWLRLNTTINDFNQLVDLPYNQQGNGQLIIDHLTGYVNSIKEIIIAVKAGQEYATQEATALSHVVEIARILPTLNQGWRRTSSDFLTGMKSYNRLIIEQLVARKAQDWAADFAAAEQALSIFLSFNQGPHRGNQ